MSENEFLQQKEAAMRIMKEMNSKSKNNSTNYTEKPSPQQIKIPVHNITKPPSLQSGFDMPFMDLLKNSDTALILGLLLILFSENADKRLLFALIYILL